MAKFDDVLNAARTLSDQEKHELLAILYQETQAEEDELSPEWQAEIDRRWKEIEDGTAKLYSWEEVKEEIFQRFGYRVNPET